MLRNVHYLQRKSLDLLYKVIVRSVTDYALPLYYSSLNISQKKRLAQIQYRAAKLCTGALHLTSQIKLELYIGWESLETRATCLGLGIFQKILNGNTRPLVRKCMPFFNSERHHNTRHQRIFNTTKNSSVKFSRSFFPYITKKYELLPKSCRVKTDKDVFKQELKIIFVPNVTSSYQWVLKLDVNS